MSGRPLFRALAALLVASALVSVRAQSLTGTHGLVFIPTARMHPDGALVVGGGLIPGRHSSHGDQRLVYAPLYASLTLLPAVEVGFRFTRSVNSGSPEALGDRMFMVRVRALREGDLMPAVAVGIHDFLRSSGRPTNFFNALYVVASKRVILGDRAVLSGLDLHGGYGTDALDAAGHQFVGPFGGAEVALLQTPGRPIERASLLGEYDGHVVSVGSRIEAAYGITVTAALQGLDTPVVGAALVTRL